ncbi:MAG: glycosyltransferase [Bacteroidota bacterium]
MLSILIPVYCFDVRPLVQDLWEQAQQIDAPWEIRLLDDASNEEWQHKNRELAKLTGVSYEELTSNIGRAQMRNTLTTAAQFEYLLFMDCDSGVPDQAFLQRYVQALQSGTVLCGGRTYNSAPSTKAVQLHWWYGSEREVKTAQQRQKRPYEGFMTNNFVVPRSVAQQFPFEAQLQHYGHEDTLFGLELKRHQIPIQHLDNPLLHIGLDDTANWLHKQQQAIKNLFWLSRRHPDLETRALRLWNWLHNCGLLRLSYGCLSRRSMHWQQRLQTEQRPPLRLLDGLKIFWLEQAWRGQREN